MKPTHDMIEAAQSVHPQSSIERVTPLLGGSSAEVAALDLRLPSNDAQDTGEFQRVVFRQHTNRSEKDQEGDTATKELDVLQHLHALGFAVPKPFTLHTASAVDGPWLTMEWVDGSRAEAGDGTIEAMADFLSRLHAVSPAGLTLPHVEDPAIELASYLPDDDVGMSVADRLPTTRRVPNEPVLLHGDYWPGNVLMRSGEADIAAVIDWEDAQIGDPLADLATARVELSCAFSVDDAERFTKLYLQHRDDGESSHQATSVDLTDLPLWEMYVSATALTSMHLWNLTPDAESTQRAGTQAFFDRAAQAFLG